MMDLTGLNIGSLYKELKVSSLSRVFVFDDWLNKQHFAKQFFSGIFIVIVMTGLDQDMMQKNLSCKSLSEAQKNMYWYGFAFIPVNLLFLILGFLILFFTGQQNINLPLNGDEILPFISMNYFNGFIMLVFDLCEIAAAISSAASAITALTTSSTI